ncbi:hypothetical protein DKZ27_04270 [Limosilactobacillus reuteri]|uniref:Uncharacterized protein n=2 Tax=Limosilactobacillus reuteri TaxID=1598 RepID=A0A855XLF8_LIMRT|nr:hypothetical protein [Limosilactobacillus reuteri]PWT30903.1 hypothetical protein DKZ27_04270 [Limosilactobacillus reuteri]PWT33150.1 hypothetical protein DKZ24_11670 [Limosilactobacillus reuteri]PWT39206.1 hypothetical protein DKZ34_09670 [Limosilactobacillus reuteri]PWT39470.1 hypothetical protein DKZ22_10835 [Limosilactobacillus reuteri]PWT55787.1 hypothetical protein DKZ31_01520 [Limosilactobacillus reuteri]
MSRLKKLITTLTVILAIIGFSFCLGSTVHADMMSPSSPTNLTNPSNPASPISPLNPANPASPLNPDNMEHDEEEHENSNNRMSDKDEKLGIVIIGIFLVGVVFALVFLIIQAS